MFRNSRNAHNGQSQNSYRNKSNLRSSSSLAQKRNYNTFQEDPQKAVFLSGFKTNIPEYRWKEYREAIYQDLQKYYGVYIRKLDLPVNHRFGYLHTKTVEQAENLLNLRNERDAETGKVLSQLDLARNTRFNWRTKICVYEYERKNEGRHLGQSRMGSRNHSIERNLNVRARSDRSYNAGSDSPQSAWSFNRNYPESRSRNDYSLSTNGFISEDFSRSTSPSDNDNHGKTLQSARIAAYDAFQNTEKSSQTNFNNIDIVPKDSANVTEFGSEDENLENIDNLLLKNRSKSTSTKTVVAAENNNSSSNFGMDQQIVNICEDESDAEMDFSSDDSNKIMKNFENNNNTAAIAANQNHVNFQEVAEQTRDKIIYEGLKQNWLDNYSSLSNHVQQSLMLNYHDACYAHGLKYAAQQLSIQGCLAIFLQNQGIQTL